MKGQTELRKRDVKRAVMLALACLFLSCFLHVKWFEAARKEREHVQRLVTDAQLNLQSSTRAEEELERIEERVKILGEAVREIENHFPDKTGLAGRFGKEIIDAVSGSSLELLFLDNSEPERSAGGLYGIKYRIKLSGEYSAMLGFVEYFERLLFCRISYLRLAIDENGIILSEITLMAYGLEK